MLQAIHDNFITNNIIETITLHYVIPKPCLVSGDYLSLDETLYPMRTKISFKIVQPKQTGKAWVISESYKRSTLSIAARSLLLLFVVSRSGILENIMYLAHLN